MLLLACAARDDVPQPPAEAPGPWDVEGLVNIAHRGGGLLAPEETLVAYENAVAVGAGALECDTHATSDGVVVCMHDETVDRTTDGTGAIRDLTFEALRTLDAGYRFTPDDGQTYPWRGAGLVVPTLAEVLAAFPDVRFSVEIKQAEPSIVDAVIADVDANGGRARVVGGSFDDATAAALRAAAPDLETAFSLTETLLFVENAADDDYVPPARFLQSPMYLGDTLLVDASFVDGAHALGLAVHPWTVNDTAELEALIALGIDGIFTDDPALLSELLADGGAD
jgi:glycerophosphoryl diester phosphodiesterase